LTNDEPLMKHFKQIFKDIAAKKSGRRFFYAYLKLNQFIEHSLIFKILLIFFGILFLLLGLVMLITPGPGLLFLLIGGVLLCAISKRVAKFIDGLELKAMKTKNHYVSKYKSRKANKN
jgi:hypothetical protein